MSGTGVAFRTEFGNLWITIAQGPQHTGGMRAQLRCGIPYSTRGLTKFEREPGHLHGPAPGVRDREDHFLRDHLGVGKDLRQVHHDAARHTSRIQPRNPVGFGSLGNAHIDACIDRGAVLHPEVVGAEIGMFVQGFEIQRGEECKNLTSLFRDRLLSMVRAWV